jgi:phosphoribosylglycinamide formyltransferase-1
MTRLRVAVLASGRGSNLGALIDARTRGALAVDFVLVASDRAGANALERARDAGIPTLALDPKAHADRPAYDRALFAEIAKVQPGLIVCAGYMRLISADAVGAWLGRMINIHPSLLPAYPGLHTHARALADGASEHGASVHFVTADLDAGPVIAQARLAVEAADTPERLAERLLPLEHRLLVATVALFAAGRLALAGRGVSLDGALRANPLALTSEGTLE